MRIYDWGGVYGAFESALRNGDSFVPRIEALEVRAQTMMERTIETFESFN